MATGVLGREQELATVQRLLDERQAGPLAVIIEGDAGIGKTTLWAAALDLARKRSWRVLAARPAEAELRFSYVALRDLLGPLVDEAIEGLPGPQRRAVEIAFLRAEGHADAPALSAGVLGMLRAAAASGPVLVGIDDLQWLDADSARVLDFALRRMTTEPVGVVAASRPPGPGPVPLRLERAVGGQPPQTVVLGPMAAGELHQLVHARFERWLPPPVLRRVHAASGGNPFFALEMSRALIRRGMPSSTQALPVPITIGELVRDRLEPLSPRAREALLVVSAAPRAPAALVAAAAAADGQIAEGLAEAEDAGILVQADGGLEFTHPLLASVVYSQVPPARRRRLHRSIAAALADGGSDAKARAWHLGLGAEGPDADVADALDAAAASARSAAAPEGAAGLAELARRLTPPGRDRDRVRRTLDFAQYLFEAGDTTGARSELEALVDEMAPGPDRARVLVRLAIVRYWAESQPAGAACAQQAVAEAAPGTLTRAEAHALVAQLCHHSNLERETHARQAIELLGQQAHPDPRIMSAALVGLAMAHHYTGRGVPDQVLSKAIELEECAAKRPPVTWRARANLGLFLKWADDFDGARPILTAMCQDAADEGDESSLPDLLEQLAELELWAGDWERAARYANECVEAAQWTGQAVVISLNRCVRGLVNAHLGLADQARSDAQAGLAFAEERADPWVAGWGWRVLGFLELSLGRLADASQNLSRADTVAESIGLREPAQWRFRADQLEALIGLGELSRATELLAPFEEQARAAGRPWALATSARSRAMLLAARQNPDGAAAAIELALAHHQHLAMPFELGRTLLTQGRLRRRTKQKRAARESLQQALHIFEQLGAPLWMERTIAELARIGLRPAAPLDLTSTEKRVAELAAVGHTNREIAQALFLSVHTVEDNLRRIYRKLGIRSRTELAAKTRT
jgi:DNA-binding CsgD family transcriptional regulator